MVRSNCFPYTLKKDYIGVDRNSNKQAFVKDFVAFCRELKQHAKKDGRGMPVYINKFVCVCGEFWQFQFHATADSISTEARLFCFDYSKNPPIDQSILYPLTKWGDAGHTGARWDSELREFLMRSLTFIFIPLSQMDAGGR